MDQPYCSKCSHAFSAEGAEIGLLIYDQEKGEWQIVCATEQCSGVPGSVTVDQLQNYSLNLDHKKELTDLQTFQLEVIGLHGPCKKCNEREATVIKLGSALCEQCSKES